MGVEVKDSTGQFHSFPNAKSYTILPQIGQAVVQLFTEPDNKGEFIAMFVNPAWVKPA